MLIMARMRSLLLLALVAQPLVACVADDGAMVEEEDGDALDDGKSDSPDSADNPLNPSGRPAKYPIVLVHGFAASPERNGFNAETAQALCNDGHSVFVPTLPAFAGNARRAAVLAAEVDRILTGAVDFCGRRPATPPTRVNIIAHSMGGTDARVLIQGTDTLREYEKKVASVTTISSPQIGSAMADMVLRVGAWKDQTLGNEGGTALRALGQLAGVFIPDSPDQLPTDIYDAFFSISSENNADLWVPYGTKVFSWAGLSNVGGVPNPADEAACEGKMSLFRKTLVGTYKRHWMNVLLQPMAWVVGETTQLAPNDGLVKVTHAKWGEFRGCIPADHAAEVGAFPLSGFDHIRFLRNRAFELAARSL